MGQQEVVVAGAAPDTGNLGVTALCHSVVTGLLNSGKDLSVTVLDYKDGFRKNAYKLDENKRCNLMGVKQSKKFYNQSSFSNVRFMSASGLRLTQTSRILSGARAILDVSAGDSFTDLYGQERFHARLFSKQYAADMGVPLVLLPQTYGPFIAPESLKIAKAIMPKCKLAYARDKYSYEIMKDLLGSDFDPTIHKQGVDTAFLLDAHEPDFSLEPTLVYPSEREIFGINVSGLIFNDANIAKTQYGISVDYPNVLKVLIEKMLSESDGDIWLVPHVISTSVYHFESDNYASQKLKDSIDPKFYSRLHVLSGQYDQCLVKGFISKLDWFCGMRMHATIAGLSSQVPTANMAYSDKSLGVFESAGQQDKVFDARSLSDEDLVEKLLNAWSRREETKVELARAIPGVKALAEAQMADIVSVL